MGAGHMLVNHTKKEILAYLHVGASKARELAGNPVSAAMTTWYLLENRGDQITFVSDYDDSPFFSHSWDQVQLYAEVTDKVVDALIQAGILEDRGIAWADEDEPETIYIRDLGNIWME